MEVRKNLNDSDLRTIFYGSRDATPSSRIQVAKEMIADQERKKPIDELDASVQRSNITKLQATIKHEEEVKRIEDRDAQVKQEESARQEADKQDRAAARKAEIMSSLRADFQGDESDWERLKDRLYDEHLLSAAKAADEAAKRTVRPRL